MIGQPALRGDDRDDAPGGRLRHRRARARIAGYDLAGKTGTTSDYRDAWFVGFTGGFVTAVWIGRDDNTPMKRVTGGGAPAEIWRGFMARALPHLQAQAIPGGAPTAPPGDAIGNLLAAATPRQPAPPSDADSPDAPQPGRPKPESPPPFVGPAGAQQPAPSYQPCVHRDAAGAGRSG